MRDIYGEDIKDVKIHGHEGGEEFEYTVYDSKGEVLVSQQTMTYEELDTLYNQVTYSTDKLVEYAHVMSEATQDAKESSNALLQAAYSWGTEASLAMMDLDKIEELRDLKYDSLMGQEKEIF
jgi:hypothetical protein